MTLATSSSKSYLNILYILYVSCQNYFHTRVPILSINFTSSILYDFTFTIHNLCILFIYYLCNYTSCCTFYYLSIYLVQPLYYFIIVNKYRRATLWITNKPLLLLLLLLLLLFCWINHLKRRRLWDNKNWPAAVIVKHATTLRDFLEVPLL